MISHTLPSLTRDLDLGIYYKHKSLPGLPSSITASPPARFHSLGKKLILCCIHLRILGGQYNNCPSHFKSILFLATRSSPTLVLDVLPGQRSDLFCRITVRSLLFGHNIYSFRSLGIARSSGHRILFLLQHLAFAHLCTYGFS